MPPTTIHPICSLASEPGPDANASGKAPQIVEIVVMSIGLNLNVAALTTASEKFIPLATHLFANSTMSMPCFEIKPTKAINPI